MSRSTAFSLPLDRSVVMANVEIAWLESETRFSSSTLHTATAPASCKAIKFNALTAPNLNILFGEDRSNCSTIIDECRILESTAGSRAIVLKKCKRCCTKRVVQTYFAASKATISDLLRKQLSRNPKNKSISPVSPARNICEFRECLGLAQVFDVYIPLTRI